MKKVDKFVENCKQLYPNVPNYVLRILACDAYILEAKDLDDAGEDEDILALAGSPALRENTCTRDTKTERE